MGTKPLSLFIGPPLHANDDPAVFARFFASAGRKAVCGGTTARIAARMLGRDLELPLGPAESDAPPVGFIPGIDLVTEGVITLNGALAILSGAKGPHTQAGPRACGINGSEKLAAELERAREIRLWIGGGADRSIDPLLSRRGLMGKGEVVKRLIGTLFERHKQVTVIRV